MKEISLSIFAVLATSCTSTPHTPIGLPECRALIPVTEQIWSDLDLLRETMSHNQLADHECIEKLRGRIRLHDEAAD